MQAMAIGFHLTIKIHYSPQPGTGIKEARSSKIGMFQADLGIQRGLG